MDFEHLKANKEAREVDFEEIYIRFKEIRVSLEDQWKAMKYDDFSNMQQKLPADANQPRG